MGNDIYTNYPVKMASNFEVSAVQNFTIPSGSTGSASTEIDLGANYTAIEVRCEDCSKIQAATTLSAQYGLAAADTLVDLWAQDASAKWTSGALPTSGGFGFFLQAALGARRLRLILSQVSSGIVAFTVTGLERAA